MRKKSEVLEKILSSISEKDITECRDRMFLAVLLDEYRREKNISHEGQLIVLTKGIIAHKIGATYHKSFPKSLIIMVVSKTTKTCPQQ